MKCRHQHVVRRVRNLRNWEAINIVLLPVLFVWVWTRSDARIFWSVRTPPLVLVIYILLQGTIYWHLKLGALREGRRLPPWFCRVFRAFRVTSLLCIALAAGLAIGMLTADAARLTDILWAGALLCFAALEYVNYYHLQLKHDSRADWRYLLRYRRLRRAPLADDLRRHCA
jgi:hypothetical protein